MHFLAEKITKLKLGWNERPLTEGDAVRICRRFRVTYQEMPLATGGFYFRLKGRDYIAVDSRLPAAQRMFVMFHELGHFLLHVPETGATANFHRVGERTRKEKEADLFALCALVPKSRVETSSPEDLIDETHLTAEQIAERLEIYERYGL